MHHLNKAELWQFVWPGQGVGRWIEAAAVGGWISWAVRWRWVDRPPTSGRPAVGRAAVEQVVVAGAAGEGAECPAGDTAEDGAMLVAVVVAVVAVVAVVVGDQGGVD